MAVELIKLPKPIILYKDHPKLSVPEQIRLLMIGIANGYGGESENIKTKKIEQVGLYPVRRFSLFTRMVINIPIDGTPEVKIYMRNWIPGFYAMFGFIFNKEEMGLIKRIPLFPGEYISVNNPSIRGVYRARRFIVNR